MLSDAADEEEGDVKARFVSTNLRTTLCGSKWWSACSVDDDASQHCVCARPRCPSKMLRFICVRTFAEVFELDLLYGKNLVLGKDRSRITVPLGPRFTNDSDFSSYKSESDFKKQWEVVGETKKAFVGLVTLRPPRRVQRRVIRRMKRGGGDDV